MPFKVSGTIKDYNASDLGSKFPPNRAYISRKYIHKCYKTEINKQTDTKFQPNLFRFMKSRIL